MCQLIYEVRFFYGTFIILFPILNLIQAITIIPIPQLQHQHLTCLFILNFKRLNKSLVSLNLIVLPIVFLSCNLNVVPMEKILVLPEIHSALFKSTNSCCSAPYVIRWSCCCRCYTNTRYLMKYIA